MRKVLQSEVRGRQGSPTRGDIMVAKKVPLSKLEGPEYRGSCSVTCYLYNKEG